MADGEYVGSLPLHAEARERVLRVLVPPAVAEWHRRERDTERFDRVVSRDGRDMLTGEFAE